MNYGSSSYRTDGQSSWLSPKPPRRHPLTQWASPLHCSQNGATVRQKRRQQQQRQCDSLPDSCTTDGQYFGGKKKCHHGIVANSACLPSACRKAIGQFVSGMYSPARTHYCNTAQDWLLPTRVGDTLATATKAAKMKERERAKNLAN